MEIIIVSIGTLSKNPLWNEKIPVRASHATTTLVRSGKDLLLVDPSLPANILQTLLYDRTGLKHDAITHVFLTNWRPVHRRGIELFAKAKWFMHEAEIQAASDVLRDAEDRAARDNVPVDKLIEQEKALLARVQPAPDEMVDGVSLFPLPGYTPGQCGLLVSSPTLTTVIAGDAVPTHGHFLAGQVFQESFDLAQAKESLMEMYEIADVVIPGHDNQFISSRSAGA